MGTGRVAHRSSRRWTWVSRESRFSAGPRAHHTRKSTSKPTNMESVYERFLLTGVWGSTAICFVLSSALKKKPHTCIARVSVYGASFSIPFSHHHQNGKELSQRLRQEGRMKGELPRGWFWVRILELGSVGGKPLPRAFWDSGKVRGENSREKNGRFPQVQKTVRPPR